MCINGSNIITNTGNRIEIATPTTLWLFFHHATPPRLTVFASSLVMNWKAGPVRRHPVSWHPVHSEALPQAL